MAASANYLQMIRAKRAGKPNIILIVADGLGYGDLGCYGQQRIETRHLDRLAGEGMRFTQWYAGSPQRTASRACLLTGRPPGPLAAGAPQDSPLAGERLTLATFLQNAGYKTCALGIWGLGRAGTSGSPNAQGFDEWLGAIDAHEAYDYYPLTLWRNDRRSEIPQNAGEGPRTYAPDLYTRAALNFMRPNVKFPFFLYLATPLPGADSAWAKLTGTHPRVPSPHPYAERDWPEPERAKAAMITHLDHAVGQILAAVEELGISQDTLIVVTSSSGPWKEAGVDPSFFSSSGPLRGRGGDLYEGGLRVPFLVRWPGHVPAGKVQDQIGAHWDFFATAAELALTHAPPAVEGRSILPTLLGRSPTNSPASLCWENPDGRRGPSRLPRGRLEGRAPGPGHPSGTLQPQVGSRRTSRRGG